MLAQIIVFGDVGRVGPIGEGFLDVGDERAGGPAFRGGLFRLFQRGQVDKGLDAAARLAGGQRHVDLAVNFHVVEIRAAHKGEDFARLWADGDQRAVGDIAVGQPRHLLGDDGLGRGLQRGIEGGGHFQTGLIQRFGAKGGLQLLAHVERKMGRGHVKGEGRVGQRLQPGGVGLGRADVPGLHHQPQHHRLPVFGAVGVGIGVIDCGQLGQPGQQRGLGQGQVGHVFGKVGLRGGVCAIGKVAVIEFVEINLQDLLFGIAAADLGGEDGFVDLARQRLFGREEDQLDQLLGDGAGAGDEAALQDGIVERAQERDRVNAGVVVEIGVLGGDGGLQQVGRHAIQRHDCAPSGVGVKGLVEEVTLAVEDARALERAGAVGEFAGGGQVAGDDGIGDERAAQPQRSQHDKAEQPHQQTAAKAAARGGGVAAAGRPAHLGLGGPRLRSAARLARL